MGLSGNGGPDKKDTDPHVMAVSALQPIFPSYTSGPGSYSMIDLEWDEDEDEATHADVPVYSGPMDQEVILKEFIRMKGVSRTTAKESREVVEKIRSSRPPKARRHGKR